MAACEWLAPHRLNHRQPSCCICCSLATLHRRAVAACERLVLLCGDGCPWERRDLAVLYMHLGQFRGERSAAVDVLLMHS